ncbi:MAG: T9SS type A sorting domain-containing protein [Bacteroidota bacterium]
MKKILLLFVPLFLFFLNTSATVYYYDGAGAFNATGSWWSARNATGTNPGDFISADIFIVQGTGATTNGVGVGAVNQTMLVNAAWTMGATTGLEIEGGATVTATALISSLGTFRINNAGNYNHNALGVGNGATTDFPGSTGTGRVFGATSNVTINSWASVGAAAPQPFPVIAGLGWGNLTINITTALVGSVNMQGNLTAIQGNFLVTSTGGGALQFRLVGSTGATTLTIGGNLTCSSGSFVGTNGTSNSTINVGGSVICNGGTFQGTTNDGNFILNVTGNFTCSSGIFNGSLGGNGKPTLSITGTLTVNGGAFLGTGGSSGADLSLTAGNLICSSGTLIGSNGSGKPTFSIPGTLTVNGGAFTGTSNTGVIVLGAGDIAVSSGTMIVTSAGVANTTTVTNNITVTGGTLTFTNNSTAPTVTVGGDVSVSTGTVNFTTGSSAGVNATITGNFTVSSGAVQFGTGSGVPTVVIGKSFTANGGTINLTGTGGGSYTIGGDMSVGGSTIGRGNGLTLTININGTAPSTTGSFIMSSGSLTNGSSSTPIMVMNVAGDVLMSGGTLTMLGGSTDNTFFTLNVNGTVAGTTGKLALSGNALLTSNGQTSGWAITTYGDFTMSGTSSFVHTGSSASALRNQRLVIGGNVNLASGTTFRMENFNSVATYIKFSGGASSTSSFTNNASTYNVAGVDTTIVETGKTLILNTDWTLASTGMWFKVRGTLDLCTNYIKATGANVGDFDLALNATLKIGDVAGITALKTTLTGSVQAQNSRTFSTGASYEYCGSASSAITGTGLPSTIKDLTINNSSNVSLTNSVTLTGNLIFTTGKLLLGTKNITVPAASTITGASFGTSTSSYAVTDGTGGTFIRTGVTGSAVLFPVGPSTTRYNPVQLNNTVGSVDFTVVASTGVLPGASSGFTVKDYWSIVPGAGTPSSTISLQWNSVAIHTVDEDAQFDRTASAVTRTDGSAITNGPLTYTAASTVPSSNVYTQVTSSAITSFPTYWGVTSAPGPLITINDVTVSGQVAAQSIGINSNNNILYSIRLDAAGLSSTLTSITVPTTGSYVFGDFSSFVLYYTTTSTFSTATPLATITTPSFATTQSFSSFSQTIASGSSGYFWVVGNVSSGAVAPHNITITPALTGASGQFTYSTATPTYLTGGTHTAAGTQTIQVVNPTVTLAANFPAAGVIPHSSVDQNIHGVSFTATGSNTTLTGITFETDGSYTQTDLTTFKLWSSTVSTFSTGTATSIGSIAPGVNPQTLAFTSITPQTLTTGVPLYLYVTVDVAGIAVAVPFHTINLKALTTASFTIPGPSTKAGSAAAGNVQTIGTFVVGDYGSAIATQDWSSASNVNWNRWSGSAWVAAASGEWPQPTDNVFILAGHTVTLGSVATRTCKNLTVLGTLKSGSTVISTRNLQVYGNIYVYTGGTIGDPANLIGNNASGIGLRTYSAAGVISGNGGNINPSRIEFYGATLTLERDMTLTYHGSANLGGQLAVACYPNINSELIINTGAKLTFAPFATLGTTQAQNAVPPIKFKVTVKGTLDFIKTPDPGTARLVPGSMIYGGTSSTGLFTLKIESTGVVNANQIYPNGTTSTGVIHPTANLSVIDIDAGGVLNVDSIIDLRFAAQTITGAGTFNLLSGATMRMGSPNGITASAASGHIQTTIRNFSTGANYWYEGTVAQVTGDGLPSTVKNLVINNTVANPAGVTLTNSVATTGATTLTDGDLIIPSGLTLKSTQAIAATHYQSSVGAKLNVYGTFDNSSVTNNFTNLGTIQVYNTGTYIHHTNSINIPTATWDAAGGGNPGAICLVNGITNATPFGSSLNQSFYNFTWNCPGQNTDIYLDPNYFLTASGTVDIANTTDTTTSTTHSLYLGTSTINTYNYGPLKVSGVSPQAAKFYFSSGSMAPTININGDVTIASGNTLISNNSTNSPTVNIKGNWSNAGTFTAGNSLIRFNGTAATQTYTQSGTGNFYNIQVSNTAASLPGLTMNNDLTSTNILTLSSGAMEINGNTLTAKDVTTTSGTLSGSATSNFTINGNAYTTPLRFKNGITILKDFLISANPAQATIHTSDSLYITGGAAKGSLRLLGGTLNTNNNLVLASTIGGTAWVKPSSGTVNGNITAERYMNINTTAAARRWHLQTVPFKNDGAAQTIQQAWQEDATETPTTTSATLGVSVYNPRPGYGTHITKYIGNLANGLGYDAGSTNNPSIYYYKNPGLSGGFDTVDNTNLRKITTQEAFMIFIRGDRSIGIAGTSVAAKPTNLRAKGNIYIGNVDKTIVPGINIIGNPYAATVLLTHVEYPALGTYFNSNGGYSFDFWDPKMGGSNNVGKFMAIVSDGGGLNTYTNPPNLSGLDTGLVQAGMGLRVVYDVPHTGNRTLRFHESDKADSIDNIGLASRPVRGNRPAITSESIGKIYTALYSVQPDGSLALADGIANSFADFYNNAVDEFDARKLSSFNTREDLSIFRSGKQLAVEKRMPANINDTIFLQTHRFYDKNYQFKFFTKNFDQSLQAYLEDKFTGTSTMINMQNNGSTTYSFSLNNGNAASSDTSRFRIVFRPAFGGPLPVTYTSVKAVVQNKNVAVEWNVENQTNIKLYEVERSADGEHFTKSATVLNSNNTVYNWLDVDPIAGNNYYRIRAVLQNGEVLYSAIVKVNIGNVQPSINVYPAIVENGTTNLQFNNMPKGVYNIRLINTLGQVMMKKQLNHTGGSRTENIQLSNSAVKGTYQIEIIQPDKSKTTLKVINQ